MDGRFDVIVVGSGIAGLCAALGAAPGLEVAVITKGALDEGCSRWAQGGIAAAVEPGDTPDAHFADTMAAGAGLCDPEAVRILVEEGPQRVRELMEWGVAFDTQDGLLLTTREAAHSQPRIIHARGDATGLEIETALIRRLRASVVRVLEHQLVTDLLTDGDRCVGVETVHATTGQRRRFSAAAVILASGGAGWLWLHTTNPEPATGDGVALAYDAGAEVASLEFVQFHPTALAVPGAPRFLISEAVRGEGALIVNRAGERFLFDADERGEMASRDVVSQAIWAELRRSGESSVFLDCRPLAGRAAVRFPTIHRTCLAVGIDITRDPIPIAPAAHYLVGGVRTDVSAATSLPGLFACGEVAASGVHGANRLASNSLLESVVFAHRAIRAAAGVSPQLPGAGFARGEGAAGDQPWTAPVRSVPVYPVGVRGGLGEWKLAPVPDPGRGNGLAPEPGGESLLMDILRRAMWEGVGVVRDRPALERARSVMEAILERPPLPGLEDLRVRQSAQCARLVTEAALARQESRGCHSRSDFPDLSDNWRGLWVISRKLGARLDRHG